MLIRKSVSSYTLYTLTLLPFSPLLGWNIILVINVRSLQHFFLIYNIPRDFVFCCCGYDNKITKLFIYKYTWKTTKSHLNLAKSWNYLTVSFLMFFSRDMSTLLPWLETKIYSLKSNNKVSSKPMILRFWFWIWSKNFQELDSTTILFEVNDWTIENGIKKQITPIPKSTVQRHC